MSSTFNGSRAALLAISVLAGCSGAKGAAKAAIDSADQALAALPADAEKIAPEEVRPLSDSLQAAKAHFSQGAYAEATAAVSGLSTRVSAVGAAIPARQAALQATLDTLAVAMPRNLQAIKKRLDEIDRSKRMPRGLDAQQLQAAKDSYAQVSAAWDSVMTMGKSGDLAGAMSRALAFKATVTRSLSALGLVADERAWSNATLPPD